MVRMRADRPPHPVRVGGDVALILKEGKPDATQHRHVAHLAHPSRPARAVGVRVCDWTEAEAGG